MLSELALTAFLALSPAQCATCGPGGGGGMEFAPGMAAGSWAAGVSGTGNPYDSVSQGGGGGGDQLYPLDSTEPWLHGWFQEIPAYGGYHTFRPHNYKHVIAQMEVGGRWGMSPMMPYSHQYYNAYRQRAGMHPDFGSPQSSYQPSGRNDELGSSGPIMAATQNAQNQAELQQVAAYQRGYTGPAIPGIAAPYYQTPISQPQPAPTAQAASASREQIERIEQLQRQIEQQTFQMQLMQEQLRASSQQIQPWQTPNYAQLSEYQQQMGYQELPPPGANATTPGAYSAPPAALITPAHPGMNHGVPAMQPNGVMMPHYTNPQGYVPPQNFAPNSPINVPQMGVMLVPQNQAYFATEQAAPYGQPQGATMPGGAVHATYSTPFPQNYATPARMQQQQPAMMGSNYGSGVYPAASQQQIFYPQPAQPIPGASMNGAGYRPSNRYGR